MAKADTSGGEHRAFPRVPMEAKFALSIERDGELLFSAVLASDNLSVSGVFLRSTFFLPVGTDVGVSFNLDAELPTVFARATVVRIERPEPRHPDSGGMGLRFLEFY